MCRDRLRPAARPPSRTRAPSAAPPRRPWCPRRRRRAALLLLAPRVAARARSLARELPSRQREGLALRRAHLRIVEVDRREGVHDRGGHHEAREPLVVRRHHVPGCLVRGGLADRILIGALVVPPVPALGDVVRGELPVLLGLVEPRQEAALLLALRDVEEELPDQRAVARQVTLEVADVLEALLPDPLRQELRGQLLPRQ